MQKKLIQIWLSGTFAIVILMVIFCGCLNPISSKNIVTTNATDTSLIKTLGSENLQMVVKSNNISFIINATSPEVPSSVHLYKGVLRSGDSITHDFQQLMKVRNNVTSEIDAPEVAKRILDEFGGLPPDAILTQNETSYIETYNHKTGMVESRRPVLTSVAYNRLIEGYPVRGQSDIIMLELGENNELLRIKKIWRSLEDTHSDPSIIPADEAIEKLGRGEIVNKIPIRGDVYIYIGNIDFAFYEQSNSEQEILVEPVWIFSGKSMYGDWFSFYVYARHFADFSASPETGSAPLKVKFSDSSYIPSNRWFWDFGDGTNESVQNPVHVFRNSGSYNITLTIWGDFGSDTITKSDYITVQSNWDQNGNVGISQQE